MDRQTTVIIDISANLREHWRGIRNTGIVLILLGFIAVIAPVAASLAVNLVLGGTLLLAGVVLAIHALTTTRAAQFWWQLGVGVLNGLLGVLLLTNPLAGVITLTMLLALWLLFEGMLKLLLVMPLRGARGWGWLLASGLLPLLLGVVILVGMPGIATWVLGLIVGINLLFTGVSLVSLGYSARCA